MARYMNIDDEVHVIFKDARGQIRLLCRFGNDQDNTCDLGLVPDDIANQGPAAVRAFANEKVQEYVSAERMRREARAQRIIQLYFTYAVSYEDVVIRGCVTSVPSAAGSRGYMLLKMLEPFEVERKICIQPSSYASSIGGTRSFDDDGNLLQQEIDRQREVLVEMYKKELEQRNKPPMHPTLALLLKDSKPKDS